MADEIYINEMTGIDLKGLSMEVTFYRQLLDTLNIVPEVFRVNIDGDSYKTAGDPFLERTATKEMKENIFIIRKWKRGGWRKKWRISDKSLRVEKRWIRIIRRNMHGKWCICTCWGMRLILASWKLLV
mgnify:CR=1 FL=1